MSELSTRIVDTDYQGDIRETSKLGALPPRPTSGRRAGSHVAKRVGGRLYFIPLHFRLSNLPREPCNDIPLLPVSGALIAAHFLYTNKTFSSVYPNTQHPHVVEARSGAVYGEYGPAAASRERGA